MKEEAITERLLRDAAVTALVGDRITWGVRGQAKPLPALVLNIIDSVPVYDDGGEAGLYATRLQTDCYAEDTDTLSGHVAVHRLARAVSARLSGAEFTLKGVEVQGVFKDSEQDIFEPTTGGKKLRRVSIDFIIWHT